MRGSDVTVLSIMWKNHAIFHDSSYRVSIPQIPLNKQIAQYQQFVEDVAMLYFDLWVAYNPNGINYKGEIIPIESLEMLKPSVKIDVSQDNAWSKLAEQQWIDKMFERQQITFEELFLAET